MKFITPVKKKHKKLTGKAQCGQLCDESLRKTTIQPNGKEFTPIWGCMEHIHEDVLSWLFPKDEEYSPAQQRKEVLTHMVEQVWKLLNIRETQQPCPLVK